MFVVGISSSSSAYTGSFRHQTVTAFDPPSSSSSHRAKNSGANLKSFAIRQFEPVSASNASENRKPRNSKGSSNGVSLSKGSSKASTDAGFRSARAVSSSRGKKAQKSISHDRGRKLGFEVLNELLSMQNQSSFRNDGSDSDYSELDEIIGFKEKVDKSDDGEKTQKTMADVPSNSFRNAFKSLSYPSPSTSPSSSSSIFNRKKDSSSILNRKKDTATSSTSLDSLRGKKNAKKMHRKNRTAAELNLNSSGTAKLASPIHDDTAQDGKESDTGFASDTDDGFSSDEESVSDTEKPSLKGQEILIALQKAAIEKAKLKQQNRKSSSRASKSQVTSQSSIDWRDAKPIVLKPEWVSQIEDLERRISDLKNVSVSVSSSS